MKERGGKKTSFDAGGKEKGKGGRDKEKCEGGAGGMGTDRLSEKTNSIRDIFGHAYLNCLKIFAGDAQLSALSCEVQYVGEEALGMAMSKTGLGMGL